MIFIGKKNDFSKILNHWMGTCTHFNGKETMAEAYVYVCSMYVVCFYVCVVVCYCLSNIR